MKIVFTLILFCFISSSYGQAGEWTWMHGDTIPSAPDVWGIKGIPSPNNRPGYRGQSISWIDASGKFWLFGGIRRVNNYIAYMNDLWKFDPATNMWTWMGGPRYENSPGYYGPQNVASPNSWPHPRTKASTWSDTLGNLYMFGGENFVDPAHLFDDMWKYNTITGLWTWLGGGVQRHTNPLSNQFGQYGIKGIASPNNRPGCRYNANSWVDASGNFWMFGGNGAANSQWGYMNDLWKYNPVSGWVWISGDSSVNSTGWYGTKGVTSPANLPQCREGAGGWTDKRGNFWLLGGRGQNSGAYPYTLLNDMWKYEPGINSWTWLNGDMNGSGNPSVHGPRGHASQNYSPTGNYRSLCWTDTAGQLWANLHPPGSYYSRLSEIWRYYPLTYEWAFLDTLLPLHYGTLQTMSPANSPGEREDMTLWTDNNNNAWFFGSWRYTLSTTEEKNDLWKLNPAQYILPLHLLTFTAHLQDKITHLQWTSENEQNFSQYEIERSTNSKEWSIVGSVKSKGGSGKNEYSNDDDLSRLTAHVSRLYYRLKMVDKDGSFSYSNIVNIRLNNHSAFSIYPNPATTSVQLQFDKSMNEKVEVQVVDVNGKTVVSRQLLVVNGLCTLSISKLAMGSYVVKVKVGNEVFNDQFIIGK